MAGTEAHVPLDVDCRPVAAGCIPPGSQKSVVSVSVGGPSSKQLQELLLQSLEHDRAGVKVYQAAIKCAQREDLRADPFTTTPGTEILKKLGTSLVDAMLQQLASSW